MVDANYQSPFRDWKMPELDSYQGIQANSYRRKRAMESAHCQWQQGIETYVQTGERVALDMALEYVTDTNPPATPDSLIWMGTEPVGLRIWWDWLFLPPVVIASIVMSILFTPFCLIWMLVLVPTILAWLAVRN
jgi:hypothetical protein